MFKQNKNKTLFNVYKHLYITNVVQHAGQHIHKTFKYK